MRRLPVRLLLTGLTTAALSAPQGAQAQSAASTPVNDAPNPYRTVVGWAKLGEGRTWGSTSAVDIDKDGKSIWVAERCGANSCATSDLPSVYKFDAAGNVVKSFGADYPVPHGIHVDRDGNVWVTDCACTGGGGAGSAGAPAPTRDTRSSFSPDGSC
jgi:hypothetical protein